MKLSPLALAVALLPFTTHATATDAATDSSEALLAPALVVTSGRQVEAKKAAVAATSVFTRADIERLQVRNVDELLTRVPGVSVSRMSRRMSAVSQRWYSSADGRRRLRTADESRR